MLHTNKSDHWDANITAKACPKPQTGVAQDHALAVGVQDAYRILSDPVEPSLHASHGARPRQASGSCAVAKNQLPHSVKKWNDQLEASEHAMVSGFCAV